MVLNPRRQPGDSVIRHPRLREVEPTEATSVPLRRPRRIFSPPFILFYGFVALIVTGGLLLSLPIASDEGVFTSPELSFFTATSAATVTGHTVVNSSTYWSPFGQAVIFALMLVGGLGFMAVATFLLVLIGQRSSLRERLAMRETMGVDRMEGLRRITRNIIIVVFLIYVLGAIAIFWRIHGLDGMGLGKSVWHSAFLSVSAFNNAGFSILPEVPGGVSLERFASERFLLGSMMALIILGGIGWTVMVDVSRHRRFSRFSLDTKMVLVTSLFLWLLGAGILFFSEYSNGPTLGDRGVGDKVADSAFQSVSGRTAGFATLDFSQAEDYTKLMYPGLMFIGGAAGSVAGGIKVATIAVIIAAVVSSIRGRAQAEAFGREITHSQVLRALTVAVLGLGLIIVVVPTLTVTEPDVPFLHLLFDTVSAFGTTGASTGIVPDLSLTGKSMFMATMLIGRLGPLTLALALAPREEPAIYRFAQERVKIG